MSGDVDRSNYSKNKWDYRKTVNLSQIAHQEAKSLISKFEDSGKRLTKSEKEKIELDILATLKYTNKFFKV